MNLSISREWYGRQKSLDIRRPDMGNEVRVYTYMLQQLHLNKRKKQVLKSKVHLDYLNKLHDNFVLVPAYKATNNVIVVCKKYYLDVVIMELGSTSTSKKVNSGCMSVINRHLLKSGIDVCEQHERLPSFY